MVQPVKYGQEVSKQAARSTGASALDTLAILMAWLFFILMLFAVGTALINGY